MLYVCEPCNIQICTLGTDWTEIFLAVYITALKSIDKLSDLCFQPGDLLVGVNSKDEA